MAMYGAAKDDIKVHSSLVFQDERDEFPASDDGFGLNAAPLGMGLLGGEFNSDVEIFLQHLQGQ